MYISVFSWRRNDMAESSSLRSGAGSALTAQQYAASTVNRLSSRPVARLPSGGGVRE